MAESDAFVRLIALIRHGYRVDQDAQRDLCSVWLSKRSARIRDVFVYADGLVVAPLSSGGELRVHSDGTEDDFLQFLAQLE